MKLFISLLMALFILKVRLRLLMRLMLLLVLRSVVVVKRLFDSRRPLPTVATGRLGTWSAPSNDPYEHGAPRKLATLIRNGLVLLALTHFDGHLLRLPPWTVHVVAGRGISTALRLCVGTTWCDSAA